VCYPHNQDEVTPEKKVGLDLATGKCIYPSKLGIWDNYRVKAQLLNLGYAVSLCLSHTSTVLSLSQALFSLALSLTHTHTHVLCLSLLVLSSLIAWLCFCVLLYCCIVGLCCSTLMAIKLLMVDEIIRAGRKMGRD